MNIKEELIEIRKDLTAILNDDYNFIEETFEYDQFNLVLTRLDKVINNVIIKG